MKHHRKQELRRVTTQTMGFLLVPGFSVLSLSSAVEALREANRQSEFELYDWTLVSMDGGPVAASCGLGFDTIRATATETRFSMVFVVAGFDPLAIDPRAFGHLRYLNAHGTILGGISTGADVLASAGLLDGYRATRHWEDAIVAMEKFPEVDWTGTLIEIDRDRYTCSGGAATFDLMLNIIRADHGPQLSSRISNQFQHERIRTQMDEQKPYEEQRLAAKNSRVIAAIKLMEQNIDDVLPLNRMAEMIGISRRQLERMFSQFVGQAPANYYRDLRLKKARSLLIHTNLPVVEVATATGFTSQSHMAKTYREKFGKSPRQERFESL